MNPYLSGTLFDRFPEPVLLSRNKKIIYCNPAASNLFLRLKLGDSLPDVLTQPVIESMDPTLIMCDIEGKSWITSVQEMEEGQLYILRPSTINNLQGNDEQITTHFRIQLGRITSALQALASDDNMTAKKRDTCLSTADRSIHQMLRTIMHLESLARSSDDSYHPKSLDLAGFLSELAIELESVSQDAGWDFSYETKLSSLITMGDTKLLRNIIMELISNAIKAAIAASTAMKPLVQKPCFKMKLTREDGFAKITIRDHGRGIEESQIPRLHGAYVRKPIPDPDDGAGFGLTVVDRFIRFHGGMALCTLNDVHGSDIAICLPIQRPEGGMGVCDHQERYHSSNFDGIKLDLPDVLPITFYSKEVEDL